MADGPKRRPGKGASVQAPAEEPIAAQTAVQPVQTSTNEAVVPAARPLRQLSSPGFLSEEDSPFTWLYQPHTVTGLALAMGLIIYYGFFAPLPALDGLALARRAIVCAVLAFLVYCSIQLRDSILVRPHPVIWRVVHGMGIVYLIFLVVLLMFPIEDARQLLRVFQPQLGARPIENDKLYATDCRVFTPGDANGPFGRVKECMWDVFIIAHSLGWWCKALLLRDWRLGWALSILWEVIEYSCQKILPNFHECWWDHWVVDVLLCNGLGLFLGMYTARVLEMKSFDWTGREKKNPTPVTPLAQAKSLVHQFRPRTFTKYQWRVFEKPSNLIAVILLILMMETIEVNAFFLKYVLYLPPASPYNVYRLLFWFAISLPTTREYYAYVADDTGVRRMGPNLWLALACMLAEIMLVIKGSLSTPFPIGSHVPISVIVCWAIAITAFSAWCVVRFWGPCKRLRGVQSNVLLVVAGGALAYLCYEQDVGYGLKVPEGIDAATMVGNRPSAGMFAD